MFDSPAYRNLSELQNKKSQLRIGIAEAALYVGSFWGVGSWGTSVGNAFPAA